MMTARFISLLLCASVWVGCATPTDPSPVVSVTFDVVDRGGAAQGGVDVCVADLPCVATNPGGVAVVVVPRVGDAFVRFRVMGETYGDIYTLHGGRIRVILPRP